MGHRQPEPPKSAEAARETRLLFSWVASAVGSGIGAWIVAHQMFASDPNIVLLGSGLTALGTGVLSVPVRRRERILHDSPAPAGARTREQQLRDMLFEGEITYAQFEEAMGELVRATYLETEDPFAPFTQLERAGADEKVRKVNRQVAAKKAARSKLGMGGLGWRDVALYEVYKDWRAGEHGGPTAANPDVVEIPLVGQTRVIRKTLKPDWRGDCATCAGTGVVASSPVGVESCERCYGKGYTDAD